MSKWIIAALFLLLHIFSPVFAGEYMKNDVYVEMVEKQSYRPFLQQYENYTYVKVSSSPAWTGGTCLQDWVALQSNDKESLSIALAALSTGNKVVIRVDDSLPKIGGTHCQITTIGMKK